jgi:hypothetical protein
MLVSESHRFLFVHVQKTAGTSLTTALAPHALSPPGGRLNKLLSDLGLQRNWRKTFLRKHANLRKAQQVLPAEVYGGFCKFAFVRNPWGRLVSWYHFVQALPSHADCRPGEPFADFARRFIAKDRRSQWWMITDRDGKMGLDFVGRFESLEDDVARLGERLNLPGLAMPAGSGSKPRDYRPAYDDKLAEEVQAAWRTEIEAFGYRFDSQAL